MLERKEVYAIEAVLDYVQLECPSSGLRQYGDDEMRLQSARYLLFKAKGVKCVTCGIEGKFFAKERYVGNIRYHFNLYAIDAEGKETLMTKDHIIPHSLGGTAQLDNLQPMCAPCNVKKGHTMPVSTLGVTLGDLYPSLCSAAQKTLQESMSLDSIGDHNVASADAP